MFRKPDRKNLTRLLARSSAVALIAAIMPLGIQLTDNGVTIDTPSAHARGGGGQGGGHGGGNGHGGGSESASAAGGHANGHGKGAGAANGVGVGNNHGATASALGALNAAHASPTAMAIAAPTSRVGRVKAYRDAVIAADEAVSDQTDLNAALDLAVDQLVDITGTIGAVISGLEAKKETLDQIDDKATIEDIDAAIGTLSGFNDDTATVADVQSDLQDTIAAPGTALDDAANKSVTQGVIDALNDLLGL